jgi:hypothetical protein
MAIWDILGTFVTFFVNLVHFFPVSESCSKKNLATLLRMFLNPALNGNPAKFFLLAVAEKVFGDKEMIGLAG